MAKSKAKRRPTSRPRTHAPEPPTRPRRGYGRIIWAAMVVVAAGGAFLLAKQQAQGPNEAVAPPPTGLPHTPDYHSLLVDDRDPQHIFLGTHVGLYESTNGGRTWAFKTLEGQDAMNLARVSPKTVWTAGHDVLARSMDGGTTWEDVRPAGLPSLDVHGFAVDPRDSNRLYAAVAGEGLYRSADGGRSFQLLSDSVGANVFGLAVLPDGGILAADPQQGLLASEDADSWKVIVPQSVVGVAVDPDDPEHILATGQPGILLSTDGGETWRTVRSITDGAGPVAWAPSDPQIGYAVGFDRRLYRSDDSGASWRAVG
jgi:photosystem II stability/assembly factor-like uncharacterized protein